MIKLSWLFLTFCSALFAKELLHRASYEICYDLNMSPYAGGEDLLFSTRLIEQGTSYFAKNPPSRSFIARSLRLGELSLFYFPLNYFTSVVQHEVFGHGYRIRDINEGVVEVIGYHFTFPPPYGPGSASTHFRFDPNQLTTTDLSSISMAGFEAQSILAGQTAYKWLTSSYIDPRQAVLYLVSRFRLNFYSSTDGFDENDLGDRDLFEYVQSLNLTYTQNQLTTQEIKNLAWINFIDPFTYYAAYAWGYYVFSGKEMKIPMIPLGKYGYLFGARLGLTPFGPEYFFDNYLSKGKNPIYFYAKGGKYSENVYLGLGIFAPRIWGGGKWSLGCRFDSWRQPELLLMQGNEPLTSLDFRDPPDLENPLYSLSKQHKIRYGCAFSLIGSYRKNRAFGLETELGIKTQGFLPGYSLKRSPVVRISYLVSF